MRIRVAHHTRYDYDSPAQVLQVLRVSPRGYDGQHVAHWRLDADADVCVRRTEDAFGNVVHILSAEGPVSSLTLSAGGEVTTRDCSGLVEGAPEPLPPAVFLRETALTRPDAALKDLAAGAATRAEPLDRLHALMAAVSGAIVFETGRTDSGTSAAEALELRRGVCQDLAHVFIAGARLMGAPARYVSGHLMRPETVAQEAGHAWAEALVPGLGWVGFDPVNGVCPTEAYVRVAVGLDYLDAAPVRGTRNGGGAERLSVRLAVAPVLPTRRQQMQAQQ